MKRLLAALLLSLLAAPAYAQTNAATTNGSVTIATGSTFQTVLTASSSRRSLTIQNNNTNGDNCWLFIGAGAATKATSILLGQGGSYQRYAPYIPSDAIQATCATSSDSIYVDVQ
jgi:hypothetical protein